jgi:hypothetical protein
MPSMEPEIHAGRKGKEITLIRAKHMPSKRDRTLAEYPVEVLEAVLTVLCSRRFQKRPQDSQF